MGDGVSTREAPESVALETLGAHVGGSLGEARAASGVAARVRAKIVTRETPVVRRPFRVKRPVIAAGAGFVAMAACAAAVFVAWPRKLTFEVASAPRAAGELLAASERPMPIAFSDGTRVSLAPKAHARVADVTENGARVILESGSLHADVVHRAKTKWWVGAGSFEVRVTGTSFDVTFQPESESIVVRLEQGSVVVTGCGLGEGRRVSAGEELRASCTNPTPEAGPKAIAASALPEAPPAEVAVGGAGAPPGAPAPASAVASAPAVVAPAVGTGPARVAALLHDGKAGDALDAAEANGFDAACDALSAKDLLALAGAARYAGKIERAETALGAVRKRFAKSDEAATAAFELGRIMFDSRRSFAAGGALFDTYLAERPSGALAREALGRSLEAHDRAGDEAGAFDRAQRYLAAYPDGPHAHLAERIVRRDEESQ